MMSVLVRAAASADVDAVASLLAEAFAEFRPLYTRQAFDATTLDTTEIRRRLSEGPTWVAELNDRMVGTISALSKSDGVYVRSMAVVPSARGSGAARLLLKAVEGFAVAQRATRLYLSTTPFLLAAIRLYESAGFIRTGDPPHELLGTPLFTMEKRLPFGTSARPV